MLAHISSYYRIDKINGGLGGFRLTETPIEPFVKDLGVYGIVSDFEKRFDISNWAFFMAFDGEKPVGGAVIASRTEGVNMLSGRDDLAVLWDFRVDDDYRNQGVGQALFNMAAKWSKNQGLIQMKIECQNNNIVACKFYQKQGAVLSIIDEYAYYHTPQFRHEAQFIWFLNLV